MAQQPFLGRLALAVGTILFSVSSAFSDQLAPLGDFSSSNPILTPTASCNAGGRSFILARPNDDSTRLALIEGAQFPEGNTKVLHYFLDASRVHESNGEFRLGCFAVAGRVVIPTTQGTLTIDRAGKTSFIGYPYPVWNPIRSFSVGENVYVVGSSAEVLQVVPNAAHRWVVEPLSDDVSYHHFVAPMTASYRVADSWIELHFNTFSKRKRTFEVSGVNSYYTLSRGLVMLAEDQNSDVRLLLGDGSVANSTPVTEIRDISPGSMTPVFLGGRLFFVADERDIWMSDGSIAGTRKIFSAAKNEAAISLLGQSAGGVLSFNGVLRRIDPSGVVTTLSGELSQDWAKFARDSAGRFLITADDTYIRTNGIPAGTSVLIDEKLRSGQPIALRDRSLVANSSESFRVDRGLAEPVSFVDRAVTASGSTWPVSQFSDRLLFLDSSPELEDLYLSDGTPPGTMRIATNIKPSLRGLGAIGEDYLFSNDQGELHTLSGSDLKLRANGFSLPFAAINDSGITDSFSVGRKVVLLTDESVWITDGKESGTTLLKDLPQDTTWVSGLQLIGKTLFFEVIRHNAKTDSYTEELWLTDGTTAGTRPAVEGYPVGHAYIAADGAVYMRATDKATTLLWRKGDDCSAQQLVSVAGITFVQTRCGELVKLSNNGSAPATTVFSGSLAFLESHRGFIYFARALPQNRQMISRIAPETGLMEDVHLIEEGLDISPDSSVAESVGETLFIWLTSRDIGREPFVLSESEDECPADPRKRVKGLCGCGVADVDLNSNGRVDCEDKVDRCPRDPNKLDPGFCGCGTPDSDTNVNGSPDCLERRGPWCGYPRFNTWCGVSVTPTPGTYGFY